MSLATMPSVCLFSAEFGSDVSLNLGNNQSLLDSYFSLVPTHH